MSLPVSTPILVPTHGNNKKKIDKAITVFRVYRDVARDKMSADILSFVMTWCHFSNEESLTRLFRSSRRFSMSGGRWRPEDPE